MPKYEDYYDPDLHGINEDEEESCCGWCEECEQCMYYHNPCFPEFNEDDEE